MANIYFPPSDALCFASHVWRSAYAIRDREALSGVRGFRRGKPAVQSRLETVGRTLIAGYRTALFSGPQKLDRSLISRAPIDLRGFVVEGLAMGCVVAGAADLGSFADSGSRGVRQFVEEISPDYPCFSHMGFGAGLARVPQLWDRIFGQLDARNYRLVFDGMGFHDAYFHTRKVLRGWRRTTASLQSAAYDQGIGRALWFIVGGDIERAVTALAAFAPQRQPSLWAGLGFALTAVGWADDATLNQATTLCGDCRAELAQGAALAATALEASGAGLEHANSAARVLVGGDPHLVPSRSAA
jgi:hypothetical protein